MVIASMQDVVFGYTDRPCLEGVSLSLAEGEFIGITGPNGAAKTTMLKLLLGLLKPWSGTVHCAENRRGGEKITVSYVPQQVSSFNIGFPSTVLELVRSGRFSNLRWFQRFVRKDDAMVEKALKQVGMWELRHRKIGELSGGQKQRVCIARALAQDPVLLVLDEPTTGMVLDSRVGFYDLMRHQVTVHRRTVVMVTHDLEEVMPRLDRVIRLERKERGGWKCFTLSSCNGHFGPED